MISVLTEKRVNKLLQEIKDQNTKGCGMLKRGLDLKKCESPEEAGVAGYYSSSKNQIVICCNRMIGKSDLENTVVHELVHAYDFCRFRQLFYCKVRACSEVRAYYCGGSCATAEDLKDYASKEECLKRHAYLSTVGACKQSALSDVESVFQQCFQDESPFKSISEEKVFKPHLLPDNDKVIKATLRTSFNVKNVNIQGGVEADNHEYPFIVSLQQRSANGNFYHKCCGSIIAKKYILSAGHCAYEASASSYVAVMGTTTLSECTIAKSLFSSGNTIQSSSNCVVVRIKALHLHPNYDDYSLNNDISIFELYDEIPYSSTILPVSLASSLPALNSMQVVAGWGITSSIVNQAADHMMKASVPYVEDKYCNDLNLDMSTSDGKLCAGAGDGKDACAGDSGSALFYTSNSTFIELGVVSYGPNPCGTASAASNRGVYTAVPFHKEWIKTVSNVSVGEVNPGVIESIKTVVSSSTPLFVSFSPFYSMNFFMLVILQCLISVLIKM